MKIEITPEILEDFKNKNVPAICTVGQKNVVFNQPAIKMLVLKNGSNFLLEIEDGTLYYKDAPKGFKLAETGKYHALMANITGIGKYIETFFKTGLIKKRFEVGELKDGRRKLELIS
ncbi:MAG: hypothetical protein ACOYN4_00850 [Bacteroidales bacterium]